MKTAVVVDSGSNYYNEKVEMEGLFSIPLQIINGDAVSLEGTEITIKEVNDLLEQGVMLKTSLPALGMIEDLFNEIKSLGYERILAVPITSGISGTIGAMQSAAQFVDINFEYVDCFTAASVEIDCAIAARKLLDSGHELEEVKRRLNESIDKSNTFIIPNDLSHLARGGRLSPLAAKLGGLLKIKPILHLNRETKGIIEPFSKVRTMSKAIDHTIEAMVNAGVDENYKITIVSVRCDKEREQTADKMRTQFPNSELYVSDLVSTVSVHVGIGSLAFQYMKKVDLD